MTLVHATIHELCLFGRLVDNELYDHTINALGSEDLSENLGGGM